MAAMDKILAGLRNAEKDLEKQLAGVRSAISSLGTSGKAGRGPGRPKGKRKMTAKARKAISDAQKKRWAAQKAKAAK